MARSIGAKCMLNRNVYRRFERCVKSGFIFGINSESLTDPRLDVTLDRVMRLFWSGLYCSLLAGSSFAQFAVKDLARLGNHESQRASSYDHSGGNGDYRSLKSGATLTLLDESGPGEIRHIWITMAAGEAYHLKKIFLRMYWDGEPEPSVETPIGDFFGLGLGTYTVYQSTLLAVAPEKALNAYFPMPFARHGVITATNEGSQEITDFYWN